MGASDVIDELVTIEDIARALKLNEGHVRDRLVKRPGFPAPAINEARVKRWRASAINRWIAEQERLSTRGLKMSDNPAQHG